MKMITPDMQRAARKLIGLHDERSRSGERRLGVSVVTETWPPEINGVAHTVHRFVEHLSVRGHGVQLIRPRQTGERGSGQGRLVSEFLTRGMKVPMYPDARVGLGSRTTLARLWSLARPDLVHIATEGPLGYAALAAARRMRIPVTSDFRTNFHLYGEHYRLGWSRPLALSYLRWFHNRTVLTTVPTRRLARELSADGFANLRVVGRGVDAELFDPERRDRALRAEWGAGPDDPVAIYVGRIAAEKNLELVLRAFDALRARRPGARLVLVGDGPLRREIEQSRPDVHLLGWRRGLPLAQCYASADIFLFPSLTETFGNVVVEALAAGLAVVAFDQAAAGEHIVGGRNGWVVPPGDDDAFVAAACAIADDRTHAARLRIAARDSALRLSWDAVLVEFERVLFEALAIRGHADHAALSSAA